MAFIKVMTADNTVVAVEELDAPVYVKMQGKRKIRCEEVHAQGIVSAKGTTIYQLVGKPDLGVEEINLSAVFIAEDEYEQLIQKLSPLPPAEEEAEEPATAPEDSSVLSDAEAKATIKELQKTVAALQEHNEMLEECLMEMADIVYA